MKAFAIFTWLAILFSASIAAIAQTPDAVHFQLGNQLITIPTPDGFEEAASQFEPIRTHFARTEAADNDMLAVHFPHADCEKMRARETGPATFYTKVSVRRAIRDLDYTPERFAELLTTFRRTNSQILDVNGPTMKGVLDHLDQSLTELNQKDTHVDLSQPVNLGEFDNRPNVLGVMLLLNVKTKIGESEQVTPVLGSLSYVRIKQRLIYVYTYHSYQSREDVSRLRDFTKQWIGQILAAN
jgi:hypothetical protein